MKFLAVSAAGALAAGLSLIAPPALADSVHIGVQLGGPGVYYHEPIRYYHEPVRYYHYAPPHHVHHHVHHHGPRCGHGGDYWNIYPQRHHSRSWDRGPGRHCWRGTHGALHCR
jgi:hypothetical protein